MKKIKIPQFLIFITGVIFLALGVILFIKGTIGMSVISSLPYVIYLKFAQISLGTWNYIVQGVVFIVCIIVLGNITVKYLLSFATSVLFGLVIDLFNYLMTSVIAITLLGKILFFICGLILVAVGASSIIFSGLPMMPVDTFIREVSIKIDITIGRCKTYFDLVYLSFSVGFGLLFFGRLEGVGIGTLLSALTLGTMIGYCMRFYEKHIQLTSVFKDNRVNNLMAYSLIKKKDSTKKTGK